MINLNPFAISGLLIVLTYIPLLILILNKGKNTLSKIYFLHISSIFIWGLGAFCIGINDKLEYANFLWTTTYLGVIFIPVFLYHSIQILIKSRNNIFLILTYLQAIIFSLILLNGKMFISYQIMFNQFYFYKPTIIYLYSFISWEIIVAMAHIDLINYSRKDPTLQNKLGPVLLAGIAFIGGTSNFLPGFGIELYPYGNFVVPIYSFLITFAILKHQFLDIEIIYKKSVTYSILFGSITLFYLLIVISIEKLIQFYWGYNSPSISISTAFIIGVLAIPLRNKIQETLDRFFFNTSHRQMISENELLRQEVAQTEKLKTIAAFASGMAHEIKNPLTAIKTFVEYLPKKVHDPEFMSKFVPIVNKEVNRINELIHDLLEYSKPSPLTLKPTNIHKTINDTLDVLNSQMIAKKISVTREFDASGSQEITLDHKQIKQAFLNIFINAIDALPHDGYLRITTKFINKKFIIKITDNGCGIKKDDLPHIFDPFFTKKEGGTGLGLSITHGIIKEHGGKIFVESEVGRGTTFRIELPVSNFPPLVQLD